MLESPLISELIRLALAEDIPSGDITSELTVPTEHQSRSEIYAKESLVVCGLPLIELVCRQAGVHIEIQLQKNEGEKVSKGEILAKLSGSTRALLRLERTLLNFLQRMSGIATFTRSVVEQASGFAVCDTRKTTPGWRVLEKYAVRIGGAKNHRSSLSDMILVKNNHVDARGGDMRSTLEHVFSSKPAYIPVEVEVRNEQELTLAAGFKPDIIMLDNMSGSKLKDAVALAKKLTPNTKLEVSGGVTVDRFDEFKQLGIDFASMGALTHSARSVDISMRLLSP